ncbi:MAG: hypothetical protein HYV78_01215 [Candidatus Wildermuthbacteria bacterium]|nr:hypothetical protein [Candidatus Wildermuthbacteria bacterium]
MNQKTLPFLVLFTMLASFAGGYSFAMIRNKQALAQFEREHTVLPRSSMVQEWRTTVSGTVQSMQQQEIVLTANNEKIAVQVSPSVKVMKQTIKGEPPTGTIEMKEASVQELKTGDSVLMETTADSQGRLQAGRITVLSR